MKSSNPHPKPKTSPQELARLILLDPKSYPERSLGWEWARMVLQKPAPKPND